MKENASEHVHMKIKLFLNGLKLLVMKRSNFCALIREKAPYFAESLGHKDFIASVGWLDKFKKRHSIIQK